MGISDVMKLNIIEDEPKSLILEFEDADRAVAEAIKGEIIESDGAEFVTVVKEHPEINKARLIVKGNKPKAAVEKAIGNIEDKLKEVESKLPKK